MGFAGRVAMITGAGSGIGRATARAFAQAGARVALCDVARDALESVVGELAQANPPPLVFELDVTDQGRVESVVAEIIRTCGALDVLFNSAGILRRPMPLLEMPADLWDRHWNVNVMGTIFCAQAAAREMVHRRYGRIINVASIAADLPRMHLGHYCVSKAGVRMFTKCLALELAHTGVTVNALGPGPTDTPMVRGTARDEAALQAAQDFAVQGAPEVFRLGIPTGTINQPEDQAAAVLFLASEQASHITGQILYVDGMAKLA
ncbi:MAG: SDR family NAD(P)-dependent oxidoreductase [Candidatus Entotheonellia bacterium]